MKIGVAGVGVVGGALVKSLENKGLSLLVSYDKYKNIGSIDEILATDIVFLCLPTLYSDELKSYNKTAINDVCRTLNDRKYEGLVVIKSTVEPETCEELSGVYKNLSICHNPEFLTASSAYEDFENQSHIVLGRTSSLKDDKFDLLEKFYKETYPKAEISKCTSNESELMKLGVNNYYSVKIQFFNELYMVANKLSDTNYDNVKDLMLKNGWINPMHTIVPGTDNQLSYGGMCFPKDTNALLNYMKRIGTPHGVLEGTVKERNSMRED